MAINFDSLPTSNPFALPEAGLYRAVIVDAEMKAPKELGNPDYLKLKLELQNHEGEKVATIFDILSESDSSVVKYKLSRFLQACGIPLVGSMELKDISKVVKGKTIGVDVTVDTKGERPRAQVDVFAREVYYTLEEYETNYALLNGTSNDFEPDSGSMNTPTGDSEEMDFDAADGVDSSKTY